MGDLFARHNNYQFSGNSLGDIVHEAARSSEAEEDQEDAGWNELHAGEGGLHGLAEDHGADEI